MATHVLRNPPRPIGNVIASNLGHVLSQLAQAKAESIRENADVKMLSSLGIDPAHARFINRLPAEQKSQAVGNYLNAAALQQQQQAQEMAQPMPVAQQQQQFVPQQVEQVQQQAPQQSLAQLFGQQRPSSVLSPEILDQVLRSPARQQQQRQIAAQEQQAIQQQAAQRMQEQAPAAAPAPLEAPIARQPLKSPLAAALGGKETKADERAARKEEFEREKISRREEAEANKQTQKYYEEVINGDKAAKESDEDLKKMKRLIEKGKLPPAQLYKSLKDVEENFSSSGGAVKAAGAGAALGFATGGLPGAAIGAVGGLAVSPVATLALYGVRNAYPDTEEFEKLSNGFIRYAKNIFGSRITDADLKAFLATVPTLANTEHGKKAIIHNMELFNKAVHEKYKVMREIIKENGGKRPLDLALQVQDRLDARLSELANEWERSSESQESSILRSI